MGTTPVPVVDKALGSLARGPSAEFLIDDNAEEPIGIIGVLTIGPVVETTFNVFISDVDRVGNFELIYFLSVLYTPISCVSVSLCAVRASVAYCTPWHLSSR